MIEKYRHIDLSKRTSFLETIFTVPYLGPFIYWKVKEIKALGARLNTLFWWVTNHEVIEWSKALKFLGSDRCCPRIEGGSFNCTILNYRLYLSDFGKSVQYSPQKLMSRSA